MAVKRTGLSPVQKVMELIEDEGNPREMSKTQWREFLDEIISECRVRLEASRADGDD